jgi:hypothetical protein
MRGGILLHDHSTPALRTVIGCLLQSARRADFAVADVHLGAIDLNSDELAGLSSCRLLMQRLDIEMLTEAAELIGLGGRVARNLQLLHSFARSGVLHVRAAGALRWAPDFSVVYDLPVSTCAPAGAACLVGAHYFSHPVIANGASLTCAMTGRAAVREAASRFEELWADGHDVLPVIYDLFDDLLAHA